MDEEKLNNENEDEVMMSDESNDSDDEAHDDSNTPGGSGDVIAPKTYLPGQPLSEGEELVCDESAYIIYHQAQTGAPCLSFDILSDKLGSNREQFPMTCFIVAGTQSAQVHANNVVVLKMSNLHKVKHTDKEDDESDEEEIDEEDETEKPELTTAMIQHTGCVNRIRAACIDEKHIASTWSENGSVYIWDLTRALDAVNDTLAMKIYESEKHSTSQRPLFSFSGHLDEGFAMDWSRLCPGRLVTGDCRKDIHLWEMKQGGTWNVDQRAFIGHTASVEDIQWSPTEQTVFASCSVDRTVRVWDTRAPPHKACMITIEAAHDSDINVISWNPTEARFIVSGGDDGLIKVWDLAQYKKNEPTITFSPVAKFKHHAAPITSIEWHPTDGSVFAASGADDQLTIWDIAVEREDSSAADEPDVLPQLLFIHQGQKEIKELHWHRQLPGVIISTAHSGFNIFRSISV